MDQLPNHQQIQEWGQIPLKGRTANQGADREVSCSGQGRAGGSPLVRAETLPNGQKPITAWKPQDEGFTNVVAGQDMAQLR